MYLSGGAGVFFHGRAGVQVVLPSGEALIACDEACATGEGEVLPHPLGQDCESVAESDQEKDVDGDPRNPSRKSAQMCRGRATLL